MTQEFLSGRTALITGSVQGIGLGIAKELAKNGVHLIVHGIANEDDAKLIENELLELGAPKTMFFGNDFGDTDAIEEMMDRIIAWKAPDILVNNAGIQRTASLSEITNEVWDKVLAINLSAAFHTMKKALPIMAKNGYGRVINISSVHGLVASKMKAPYVTAKFGLVGLSKVAALEYASFGSRETGGITVNCICPGWSETAIIEPQIQERAARHNGDRNQGIADLLAEKQPSLRTTLPSEIGEIVIWLCNKAAHNITGTTIPIDGGWTAQ